MSTNSSISPSIRRRKVLFWLDTSPYHQSWKGSQFQYSIHPLYANCSTLQPTVRSHLANRRVCWTSAGTFPLTLGASLLGLDFALLCPTNPTWTLPYCDLLKILASAAYAASCHVNIWVVRPSTRTVESHSTFMSQLRRARPLVLDLSASTSLPSASLPLTSLPSTSHQQPFDRLFITTSIFDYTLDLQHLTALRVWPSSKPSTYNSMIIH